MDDVVADRVAGIQNTVNRVWRWVATQYATGNTATASGSDPYTLFIKKDGTIELSAACGTVKGDSEYSGQSVSIDIRLRRFSRCRDDDAFQLFIADIRNARDVMIREGQVQLTLASNAGVMYFETGD